jgi:nucleotide-binding universal stress UspA family protein
MPHLIAYMPVNTYPEAAEDSAILAAVGFASALGCGLHATTYAVDVPKTASPVGGLLINVEAMAATVEERSKTECARLQSLIDGVAQAGQTVVVNAHTVVLGAALDAATTEARTHDLALLPWDGETVSAQDMAQALVFDAGVPVILVPSSATTRPVDHIAIAWDGSRVAARALCDALPLLTEGGQISVLTVVGEKSLQGAALAQTLVTSLEQRGYRAKAVTLPLGGRPIAIALQEAALSEGAQMMAMGGFGHSRLRDFILGGATQGVFGDLRLPVLLAH